MKAMVLGAGVGSRLEPITGRMPKPLVPVANRPVIDHIINLLQRHNFSRLACNVHYRADQMMQHFASSSSGINVLHEAQLSGDAGGVRACREFLEDGTFVTIMGDLLTDADLTRLLALHREKNAVATIAVKPVSDVSRFGVVVRDSQGFVVDFQEKPASHEAKSNLISTGIYVLEPEIFKYMPEHGSYGFGRQLFPLLVEKGLPVLAADLSAYWTDIGTLPDYLQANCDAAAGKMDLSIDGSKEDFGWLAQSAFVHDSCRIDGKLVAGAQCRIRKNVVVEGSVVVGQGAQIAEGCRLADCLILPGEKVAAGTAVNQAVVACDRIISCRQIPAGI